MHGKDPIAHCLLFSDLANSESQQIIEIEGDEAHHASRVKRVRPGERLLLLDGEGHSATGTLESITGSRSKPLLRIELNEIVRHEPTVPEVEVWAALPKGDRLDRMIDQLTQLGVSRFRPLICDRSQRKPDSARSDKLQRIADEAMKQCHRPWRFRTGDPVTFSDALRDPDAIVADESGDVWDQNRDARPRSIILVGPEGGWSNTERGLFVESGVPVRRYGLFVLRIEAAAAASAAIVLGASIPAPDLS